MASFSLNIERKIEAGLVTCGKFDGSHACLALGSSAGSVFIHSPHREAITDTRDDKFDGRLAWNGEIAELQIGDQVTAICTGRFGEDDKDVLIVGSNDRVVAFQVENNADVFYKEVPDGACCIIIGKLAWLPDQVVIIGGRCSVRILDAEGKDVFWTATSDTVTCLAIIDFDGDGENELLTGTRDFQIQVQKEEMVAWSVKETAPITILTNLGNKQFAYSVDNGTLGVYEMEKRLWRVKSKHRVVSVMNYDVNGDGQFELVTGWTSGKVDARLRNTGEVIFKIQLSNGIAGLVEADYRRIGKSDLVIVSVSGDGNISMINASQGKQRPIIANLVRAKSICLAKIASPSCIDGVKVCLFDVNSTAVRGYGPGSAVDLPEPGEEIRQLAAKKHNLQMELRQRTASVPSMYHGTKLAVSLTSSEGAARLILASGPGLLVIGSIGCNNGVTSRTPFFSKIIDFRMNNNNKEANSNGNVY